MADSTRESVLNRAIDCRTRETILSSLHRPTRRNSVPRICAREGAMVAVTHTRSRGGLLYGNDYDRGTIYSVFGAGL